jgi:hypothetical protein
MEKVILVRDNLSADIHTIMVCVEED